MGRLINLFNYSHYIFQQQHDIKDCGAACLTMIAQYHGQKYSFNEIKKLVPLKKTGVSLKGIQVGANYIGLDSMPIECAVNELSNRMCPCILHWNQKHFVVLYKVIDKHTKHTYVIADPNHGIIRLNDIKFVSHWCSNNNKGIALLLSPTDAFFEQLPQPDRNSSLSDLLSFARPHKKLLLHLLLCMLIGCVLSLIFPFLTQSLIDYGVNNHSVSIVTKILLAEIFVFAGSMFANILRNWIVLYIGARINITIISNFILKLISLPISFFSLKQKGDLYQRIQDHNKIEEFLSNQSLSALFSVFSFVAYSLVLLHYNLTLLATYYGISTFAIIWSSYFFKYTECLDYTYFNIRSKSNDIVMEIIDGMQEVKLNALEEYETEKWEKNQLELFKANNHALRIEQLQLQGYQFINQLKNIIIIYLSAKGVIAENITLGTMLSISYIIGQLDAPLQDIIITLRSWQSAKISMERLLEIQKEQPEERSSDIKMLNYNERVAPICLKNMSFRYDIDSPFALSNICLNIPYGKTTAIVGASGSGKTTLIKLILKFYKPTSGQILINNIDAVNISAKKWRAQCGIVMQDGFIFSDTIAQNIACESTIDYNKLNEVVDLAQIRDYIESLPLRFNTIIGATGKELSGGQKQRILIARALYKNPNFVFLDEATSSLDSNNERRVYQNFQRFFKTKTVVVAAHRLSTVKNANQIVVLSHGKIVETGTHDELIRNKSTYYNLVREQLELNEL